MAKSSTTVEALQAKFRPIFDDPKEIARTPNVIQYKVLGDAISFILALCPLDGRAQLWSTMGLYGRERRLVSIIYLGTAALGCGVEGSPARTSTWLVARARKILRPTNTGSGSRHWSDVVVIAPMSSF